MVVCEVGRPWQLYPGNACACSCHTGVQRYVYCCNMDHHKQTQRAVSASSIADICFQERAFAMHAHPPGLSAGCTQLLPAFRGWYLRATNSSLQSSATKSLLRVCTTKW